MVRALVALSAVLAAVTLASAPHAAPSPGKQYFAPSGSGALFLVSGGLICAGAGAIYKGTSGLVLDGASPDNRVALTAELLIVLFIGLSVPVIGAGVALDRGASSSNTVLVFAILVGLGVAGSGLGLLGRRPGSSPQTT